MQTEIGAGAVPERRCFQILAFKYFLGPCYRSPPRGHNPSARWEFFNGALLLRASTVVLVILVVGLDIDRIALGSGVLGHLSSIFAQ